MPHHSRENNNKLVIITLLILSAILLGINIIIILLRYHYHHQIHKIKIEAGVMTEVNKTNTEGQLSLVILDFRTFAETNNTTLESGTISTPNYNNLFKMFVQHTKKEFVLPDISVYLGCAAGGTCSKYSVNASTRIKHVSGDPGMDYTRKFFQHKFVSPDPRKKDSQGNDYYMFGWDQFAIVEFLTNSSNGFLASDGSLKLTMDVSIAG